MSTEPVTLPTIPAAERPAPPPLVIRGPLCSVCETETNCDSTSIWCSSCGATWDAQEPETPGEWPDGEDACGATCVNTWTGKTYACVLAAGHPTDDGQWHQHPDICGWRGDARAGTSETVL